MSDIATALQNLSAAIDALSARVQTCFDTAYHRGANMPQQRSTSTLSAVISSDLIAQEIFTGQANSNHQLDWYNQDGSRPQDGHADVELFKGCQSVNFSDPTLTTQNQFRYLLRGCKGIRDVIMPDVIDLNVNNLMNNAFNNSTIRSFKAPKLQTIGSGTISLTGCQNLEEINLSSLLSPSTTVLVDAKNCTSLKTANFHNMLCAYTCANMFEGCTSLSSVDFSRLTYFKVGSSIGGNLRYMFKGCTSLSSVSFPRLDNSLTSGWATLNYANGMFEGCTSLSSVEWPYLKSITTASAAYPALSGTFKDCPLMTTVRFPRLHSFGWNSTLTTPPIQSWNYTEKIYFNDLYSIGNNNNVSTIFVDMPALRELHFAAKYRQNIEASPGFPTQWGLNGQVTVYFDL